MNLHCSSLNSIRQWGTTFKAESKGDLKSHCLSPNSVHIKGTTFKQESKGDLNLHCLSLNVLVLIILDNAMALGFMIRGDM